MIYSHESRFFILDTVISKFKRPKKFYTLFVCSCNNSLGLEKIRWAQSGIEKVFLKLLYFNFFI